MNKKVVVTGVGVLTSIGNNKEDFAKGLFAGKSGIAEITKFDASSYSSRIGSEIHSFNTNLLSEKEKRKYSLFIQYALYSAHQAIEDSGLCLSMCSPKRIGVIVGSGIGGIDTVEKEYQNLLSKGPARVSPYLIPMIIIDMAAGVIAIHFGLKGHNEAVATACATSTHAIGGAFRIIQRGDADVMVTGGTEAALTPLGLAGFCSARALSNRNDEPQRASRPFDRERDGFVMGDGAGTLILEEEEHAKKRGAEIYAEIIGYGTSGDAHHITAPCADGEGAATCMENALSDAKLSLDQIDCINAHGTSTQLGDKAETLAIKKVFGNVAKKIPITANKSMFGHLLGATGAVEVIASILGMKEGIIPPTINYEYPDPDCDLDYVPNKAREIKINTFLSNSFGFGGHNASLIFKRYE
ncbi:MAG: beta-ketoacyl-ACP synthase II [Candidatus Desantisbacteria bacterium]